MAFINDVGGMHGFGPVHADHSAVDEPFASVWESQVFALNYALIERGVYTLDEFRATIENLEPAEYLALPYYERWLAAVERLVERKVAR
jgi:nitrile hydratase subunit beta